jgi:hypothetical protein
MKRLKPVIDIKNYAKLNKKVAIAFKLSTHAQKK